jgi:predicted CoA-binding protein
MIDDIAGLRRVLLTNRVIAMVGLSANWFRPSYFAAKYMLDHGYRVIPVNPAYQEVLGQKCYPSLRAIPVGVDMVDCFRRAEEMPAIAQDAIAIGAKTLWLQLGVVNVGAAELAQAAGLEVVMDRCVKIEYARLFGGLSWAGVNTGVISAKRPPCPMPFEH